MQQKVDITKYGAHNITPIEKYGGIYFKRDDKFKPFNDSLINGGKVRQILFLLYNNYDKIVKSHNSTVSTATSVHSPQGVNITRVANEFGFRTIVGIGNHLDLEAVKKKHILIENIIKLGGEVRILSKLGYNNILYNKLINMSKKERFFITWFGFNLESNPEAIIDSISNQVQNIPKDLDVLVVPIGSGITFGGIIKGLKKFNIKPKRVVGVQISGYERRGMVDKISQGYPTILNFDSYHKNSEIKYEYVQINDVPYTKEIKIKFNKEEYMDYIYESKAFRWLLDNIDYKNLKTLFWVVGNNNKMRDGYP